MKRMLIAAAAMLMASPACAQSFDWHVTSNRLKIDGAMRNFAKNCNHLGFTIITGNSPAQVEKKLYAYLLLKPSYEVDSKLEEWAGYINAMTSLGDKGAIESAGDAAGDAMIAADVDPESVEAARKKFVGVFHDGFSGLMTACAQAANDSFLNQYYLSGSGNWDWVDQMANDHWSHRSDPEKK